MNKICWKSIFVSVFAVCLLAGIASCSRIRRYISDDRNPPVARVYDAYLYKTDIPDIIPQGTSAADSAAIVGRYIDSWITRQLILNTSQMNMSPGDLEKEIADFRELLLTGRYEQQIISQRLDTTVSQKEIQEYYQANKQGFILDKPVVCWSYLPVTYCDASLKRKLRTAFAQDKAPAPKRGRNRNAPQVEEQPWNWYSGVERVMNEESYSAPLVRDQWTEVETLLSRYDVDSNFEQVVKDGYSFTARNSEGEYLGRIGRYVRRGETAPLEYVSHRIKGIILNRRTAETLRQAEAELRQDAEKNGKLEIFKPNEDK